ncbi:hypothetical protein NDU88_005670 [Pleurodeles waltl]|uniref:Uncharacterized protein n=1 Tax=Pleurodeles waltl TaxID=8319 RepID=A0AAV7PIQ8_PLEWA|nr:hypothetical protein NDU88_005670 [Pleurodeles waltl]
MNVGRECALDRARQLYVRILVALHACSPTVIRHSSADSPGLSSAVMESREPHTELVGQYQDPEGSIPQWLRTGQSPEPPRPHP